MTVDHLTTILATFAGGQIRVNAVADAYLGMVGAWYLTGQTVLVDGGLSLMT